MKAGKIIKLVQKTLVQTSALLGTLDREALPEIKGAIAGKCQQVREALRKVTTKERELLELIHREPGLPVKQLAAALKKSEGSVKAQLLSLYRKFEVNSRVELIAKTGPFFHKPA
jgi:DNA-binding NarL/FixJ family response regulator